MYCSVFFLFVFFGSMEVGVCAEAYQGEEPLRHINSAFMTFEVLDENGRPRPLPRIRPEPLVRPRSRLTSCVLLISRIGTVRQIFKNDILF